MKTNNQFKWYTLKNFINHIRWFGEDRPFNVSEWRWSAMLRRLNVDGFTFLTELAENPWGD